MLQCIRILVVAMGFLWGAVNLTQAASHFVRQGAAGNNNGSDWTNAYTTLPTTLARSDTYYVADGSYGSYTFDDGVSGTNIITVRKAIAADHGTDAGWNVTYGDGVALFTDVNFATSYYVFDGVTGGGPGHWNDGFGFEITRITSVCGDNGNLISLGSNASNITVRHAHLYSASKNYPLDGIKGTAGAANLTIAYNSIHTIFGCPFFMGAWSNCVIEYNYIADNRSTGAGDQYCSDWHSEGVSSIGTNTNITFRYNLWDRITGTAVIAGINSNTDEAWKVYGNIFSRSTTTLYSYYAGSNSSVINNLEFYNNDIVGIPGVSQGGIVINQGTNNKVFNNIWYNNIANAFGIDAAHGYNYFADNRRVEGCTPTCDKNAEAATNDTSAQVGPGVCPFVNADSTADPLTADYHLKAATNAGKTLSSPFNTDMYGLTRGAIGVWDRGAVEYAPTIVQTTSFEVRTLATPMLFSNPLRVQDKIMLGTIKDKELFDLSGRPVTIAQLRHNGMYLLKTDGILQKIVIIQ